MTIGNGECFPRNVAPDMKSGTYRPVQCASPLVKMAIGNGEEQDSWNLKKCPVYPSWNVIRWAKE